MDRIPTWTLPIRIQFQRVNVLKILGRGKFNFSYSYLLVSNKHIYMFEITPCCFCAFGPAYVGIVGGASLLGFYEQEWQLFGSLVFPFVGQATRSALDAASPAFPKAE